MTHAAKSSARVRLCLVPSSLALMSAIVTLVSITAPAINLAAATPEGGSQVLEGRAGRAYDGAILANVHSVDHSATGRDG